MIPEGESRLKNNIINFSDDEEDINDFKPLHVANQKLLENSDEVNELDDLTRNK